MVTISSSTLTPCFNTSTTTGTTVKRVRYTGGLAAYVCLMVAVTPIQAGRGIHPRYVLMHGRQQQLQTMRGEEVRL